MLKWSFQCLMVRIQECGNNDPKEGQAFQLMSNCKLLTASAYEPVRRGGGQTMHLTRGAPETRANQTRTRKTQNMYMSVPQGVPWLVAMGQRLGLGSMGMGLSMATLGRGRATMERSSTEPTKICFAEFFEKRRVELRAHHSD